MIDKVVTPTSSTRSQLNLARLLLSSCRGPVVYYYAGRVLYWHCTHYNDDITLSDAVFGDIPVQSIHFGYCPVQSINFWYCPDQSIYFGYCPVQSINFGDSSVLPCPNY